jgi:hypothetical protein
MHSRVALVKLYATVVSVSALCLAGCDWFSPSRYAAEVGYYAGREVAWDLWGDFDDLDTCRSAAIARFNYYAAQNNRGYTWSCLLKNGKGGYVSRHR